MGGLVCCSISTDRKDDPSLYVPSSYHQNSNGHKKQQSKNLSPGKPSADSDQIWEMTDDLRTWYEREFLFVIKIKGFYKLLID